MLTKLKKIRKARKISQKELARQAGVSPAYISLIETGKKTPALKLIPRIAEALRVSPCDLCSYSETPPPDKLEFEHLELEIIKETKKLSPDEKKVLLKFIEFLASKS